MRKPISVKQVQTEYEYDEAADWHWEVAVCPFCDAEICGVYGLRGHLELYEGYGDDCVHFEGFVSAGGTATAAQFRGIVEVNHE